MLDLRNFALYFKNLAGRAWGFNFTKVINPPADFAEIIGHHAHKIKDTAAGWEVEIGTSPINTGSTITAAGDIKGRANFAFGPDGAETISGNSTTGVLTATTFTGALSGNAATATTAAACTGNAATATAMAAGLVRTTAEYVDACALEPADVAKWVGSASHMGKTLGASETNEIMWARIPECEGRTMTGWKIAGGYVETTGVTVTAQMYKYGAGGLAAVGDAVTLTKAGGVLSGAHTLAVAEVMTANTCYALKIDGTTGVGDSATIIAAKVAVR